MPLYIAASQSDYVGLSMQLYLAAVEKKIL